MYHTNRYRTKKKGGFAALKEICSTSCRHIASEVRRFRRRGGLSFWLRDTLLKLRRGNRRTIATCCISLLCAGLCIWGIVALAQGGNAGANAASYAAQAPGSGARTVVSLESDLESLQALPTPLPAPTPTPMLFLKGYEGPEVAQIQQRLMDLGYMDNDEPTQKYGPATTEAVELFQRSNGLPIDGRMEQTTYDALMSSDAKKYMVSLGISGTDVTELQKRLVELDYLGKTTGYFGEETEAAVKTFQTRNHLSADGKVGEYTREMLYSEDAIPKSISYGEKSDDVLKYQQRLFKLGYLTTDPDGTFGRDTVNATKLFQQINGMIMDGHIGPQTRKLLMSADAQANALTLGMKGDTITKVQQKLKSLGYLSGKATGYYGSATEDAVQAFQKQNKLSADGKAGRHTMQTLFSSGAKAAPAEYTPSTGTDSGSSGSSGGSSGSSGGSSSSSGSGSLDAFIAAAKSKLGSRYVRGGKGPSTFDCSGFVYWCLRQAGVSQNYLTSSGWRSASNYQKVSSLSSLHKGDIIVFKGHVGIAMGDGTMIDASSSSRQVVHRSCLGDWSQRNFIVAWRVF
ncbi:MAG: peptidoglycan-binding protein [Christensenellaceae bacterium]|jgi:peptidoglycan hydrolase-like protein with peptidoglycan-binding domain|nr:peptidoglycan-binding protein [Christensenellaceae bacterium]